MANPTFYDSLIPDQSGNNLANTNPLGSQYAIQFNREQNPILKRAVNQFIYNTAPLQFLDLNLFFAKTPKVIMDDYHEWFEAPYDRQALQTTGAVNSGASQVVPLAPVSMGYVAKNMIIGCTDGTPAVVVGVDPSAMTITLNAPSGGTLPAIANNDLLTFNSTIDPDGTTTINPTYRLNVQQRYNFIQSVSLKQRFGKRELMKYQNQNLTDYLSMQKERMTFQFKVQKSNAIWTGQRTEITSAEGIPSKLVGGIDYFMNIFGAPSTTVTPANITAAFESFVFKTEYGAYGKRRFLFATPQLINTICLQYKRNLIRYAPKNDMIAQLELDEINLGSSTIVFVPMKRFEDESSFPAAQGWQNRMYCLDLDSITPVVNFGDSMGTTLARGQGSLNNYVDTYIDGSVGLEFPNPKGCFKITVNQ